MAEAERSKSTEVDLHRETSRIGCRHSRKSGHTLAQRLHLKLKLAPVVVSVGRQVTGSARPRNEACGREGLNEVRVVAEAGVPGPHPLQVANQVRSLAFRLSPGGSLLATRIGLSTHLRSEFGGRGFA